MSERDSETGQFTAAAEPLFGRDGIEQDAGFVPMRDETKEEPKGELTEREAAAELAMAREAPSDSYDPVVHRYVDSIGNLAPTTEDGKPLETTTLERAAKDLSDIHSEERKATEDEIEDQIRAEIDKLRGNIKDPHAEAPKEAETEEAEAQEAAPVKEGELHPDVEKFWKIPQVREAVQKVHAESEGVKQAYSKGLDTSLEFARASFVEHVPELASLPVEQWEGALVALAQRDPARINKALGTLQRVAQLQTAQQQQQQQRAEAERVRLKAESDRFEEKIRDVPRARRAEVENEIVAALKERGQSMEEVVKFLRTSEASSSAVMELLWELGDTRSQLKAIRNAPKAVATKELPRVTRPGTAAPRMSRESSNIKTLEAKLDGAVGHSAIKIAAQLQAAKRAARG